MSRFVVFSVLGLIATDARITAPDETASLNQMPCLRPREQRLQLLADHCETTTIIKLAKKARSLAALVTKRSTQRNMAKKHSKESCIFEKESNTHKSNLWASFEM